MKRRLSEGIYIDHGSPEIGEIAYLPVKSTFGFEKVYGEIIGIDSSEKGFITLKIKPFKHQRRNRALFELRFKNQINDRITTI